MILLMHGQVWPIEVVLVRKARGESSSIGLLPAILPKQAGQLWRSG